MKVCLVDIDKKFPNLALMKLSTWHKNNDVKLGYYPLFDSDADRVYASCVFPQNRDKVDALLDNYPKAEVGGTGWDIEKKLPEEVEELRPDYNLYGIDYGLGFTSRGCIRNCPWCIVPKKEGGIKSVRTIPEILNPRSNFVVLLDNNFFAQPEWRDRIAEMVGLIICFNQGLDIRLVDEEVAAALSGIHYVALNGVTRRLYFSYDDIRFEREVRRGIGELSKRGIPTSHLMFYMLIGFKEEMLSEEDWERYKQLKALGVKPFPMPYNRGNRELRRFARWVIRRYDEVIDWGEFGGKSEIRSLLEL